MSDSQLDGDRVRMALEAWTRAETDEREIPVDLDEVCAWVSGSLPETEAAAVSDRIVRDPQAARLAASMASFRDERSPAESVDTGAVLGAREIEQDWQELARRVGMESPKSAELELGDPATLVPSVAPRRWAPTVLAAAAGVILALGVGVFGQHRLESERRTPRLNVASTEIWEDATRRSGAEPIAIPDDAAFRLLVLKLVRGDEGPDPLAFEQHALEIWRSPSVAGSSPVWQSSGVRLENDLTVTLEVARDFLAAGSYELRLLGRRGLEEETLATFAIQIR